MEKRIIGVILTLIGVIGLIMCGVSFAQHSGSYNIKLMAIYGILGLIFFVAGIGIIRSVKDVINNNEHVS